ncbi:TPA: hypothetical protein ACH3X2_002306 [Trebouxia sp. C0005]
MGLPPGCQSLGNSCQSFWQSDHHDCSASFGMEDFAMVFVKAAADANLPVGSYILLARKSTRPSRLCLASERSDNPEQQAAGLLSDLEDAVRDIAVAKAALKMRGVELFMQLRPFWKQGRYCDWHLPARLAVMAPVIDDVFVPNAMQDAMQDQRGNHNVIFSPAHLLPFVSAGRLRRLCAYSFPDMIVSAQLQSICSIANLTNLTSLQLVNCRSLQLTELQHLSHLLELRLEFTHTHQFNDPTLLCCAKTLGSCRYLRHISLCAHAWSNATYRAVSHLPSLLTLSISVKCLSRRSAEVVGCLTPPGSVSVALHKEVTPKALKALTLGPVRITCLELWRVTDRTVSCLHPMPHLVALKLGWPNFTGRLGYQPRLQYLTLTSVPYDFSVDEYRLRQFLDVLPTLLTLEVKSEQKRSNYGPYGFNGPNASFYDMRFVPAALFVEMPQSRLLNATWCEAIDLNI